MIHRWCERIWSDRFPAEERSDVEKFRSNADCNPQYSKIETLNYC